MGLDVSYPNGEPFNIIASTVPASSPPQGGGLGFVIVILTVMIVGVYGVTRSNRRKIVVGGQIPVVSSSAYLQMLSELNPGRHIPLQDNMVKIGRAKDNDIILSDTAISRYHAVLRFAQGQWFLQDQSSTTGTYVNNQKIVAIRLTSGDKIQIGADIFTFVVESEAV